jgi:hypothetical protein
MLKMVADFETTTTPNDVRVWAWCMVNIDTLQVEGIDTNIESFIEFLADKNCAVYFHNLKFDGEFIIHWLLSNGYTHSDTKEEKTFDTLIADTGQFYSITVYFKKLNKRYLKCTFYDSLKKLPFSVDVISKAFNLPLSKLSIDYNDYRGKDHILTELEYNYIVSDCMIVAQALKIQFEKGLQRMTIGSDALNGFKDIITKTYFDNWFPVLPHNVDSDIRQSYKGGFTYLNPLYKGTRQKGVCYDVNSLYPYVMYDKPLPYGYPIYYEGEYQQDNFYPLYIQRIRCEFTLKENHIPTIQLKNNRAFIQTEYLKSSNGEIVELTLTSVDLKLFLTHYDTINLEYDCGWCFKSCTGFFGSYIDYWKEVKENNEGALRTLAKLMLNSLYGKFGSNPKRAKKIPYLSEKKAVKYKVKKEEPANPVYTAIACFVTAWSRYITITTAQSVYDRFIYADTDSIHLVGHDEPTNINIHPTKMGTWKCEGFFSDSKFLRAKTYIETIDSELEVTCAGMPDNLKKQVTYDNFKVGSKFAGKLSPRHYDGGIVLEEIDFTIKE